MNPLKWLKAKFDSYILNLVRQEISSYFENTENKKEPIPDEYAIASNKQYLKQLKDINNGR